MPGSDRYRRPRLFVATLTVALVALAGKVADLTQLSTAVLMMAASGAIGAVLCFFLVETAPVKVRAAMARAG